MSASISIAGTVVLASIQKSASISIAGTVVHFAEKINKWYTV